MLKNKGNNTCLEFNLKRQLKDEHHFVTHPNFLIDLTMSLKVKIMER